MALLGLIKTGVKEVVARYKDWMSVPYVKDVLATALLVGGEEFLNHLLANLMKLSGWKRMAWKEGFRLVSSAAIFYHFKDMAPNIAVPASMFPVVLAVADGAAYIFGGGPEALATKVARMLEEKLSGFRGSFRHVSYTVVTSRAPALREAETTVTVVEERPSATLVASSGSELGGAF